MSEKEVPVSERIKILFQHFGDGNLSAFARELGVSAQAIRDLMRGEKGGPSWPVLQNILRAFPSISTDWLVLGKGAMLRPGVISIEVPDMSAPDLDSVKKHVSDVYNAQMKENIDASLREMNEKLKTVTDKAIQAKVDAEAMVNIYWIGKPDPSRPYNGLLTERLNISEEEARHLVLSGEISAGKFGKSNRITNYRIGEFAVRKFLEGISADQQKTKFDEH